MRFRKSYWKKLVRGTKDLRRLILAFSAYMTPLYIQRSGRNKNWSESGGCKLSLYSTFLNISWILYSISFFADEVYLWLEDVKQSSPLIYTVNWFAGGMLKE